MNYSLILLAGISIAVALKGVATAAEWNESALITGVEGLDVSSHDSTYGRVVDHVLEEDGQWLSLTEPADVMLNLGGFSHLTRLSAPNSWETRVPARSARGIKVSVPPVTNADFIQLDAALYPDGVQQLALKQPQPPLKDVRESIDLSGNSSARDAQGLRMVMNDGDGLDAVGSYNAIRPDAEAGLQAKGERYEQRLRQIALAETRGDDATRAAFLKTNPPGRPKVERFLESIERKHNTLRLSAEGDTEPESRNRRFQRLSVAGAIHPDHPAQSICSMHRGPAAESRGSWQQDG